MTSEEKRLIADCRVMIIGASDFIDNVKAELYRSGFKSINIVSGNDVHTEIGPVDMVVEYAGEACTHVKGNAAIPITYPFDFVDGAGAIVVMPGDDNELHGITTIGCRVYGRVLRLLEYGGLRLVTVCSAEDKRRQDERGGTTDSGAYLRTDSRQHRRRPRGEAFSEILSLQ